MKEEHQTTMDLIQDRIEEIRSKFFEYIKVIALYFIAPIWIVIFINGAVLIWKILSWIDSKFWTTGYLLFLISILFIVMPVLYLIWFYHLALKKVLIKIYNDLLIDWNKEIGSFCAKNLIELEGKEKDRRKKFDLEVVLIYINKKIASTT